jgi:IS30 family transposase
MRYTHLTRDERYQIHELRAEKNTASEIARQLGRHKSTISRELRRNAGKHRWKPGLAHATAEQRQKNCRNARRISDAHWSAVTAYLRLDLSPQQAIGRLKLENNRVAISHETVYRHIYANQRGSGELVQHLRGQKTYRKRYGSGQQRRGRIKNRVSIDERPDIVNQKTRLGDWEGDTVIGKGQQGVLVTLVERRSRYTLAQRLDSKHADGVSAAINALLTPHKEQCHTITFDNGREFAGHESIAAHLQAAVYFAHPYHSWERGVNENTNGLIRQYHPKNTNLKQVSQEQVALTVHKLNHRPRKCLGYQTPHEVFFGLKILPLNSIASCTS